MLNIIKVNNRTNETWFQYGEVFCYKINFNGKRVLKITWVINYIVYAEIVHKLSS